MSGNKILIPDCKVCHPKAFVVENIAAFYIRGSEGQDYDLNIRMNNGEMNTIYSGCTKDCESLLNYILN